MNAQPDSQGCRRIAREECQVGDWVDAGDMPDWSPDMASHEFLRERVSISPWNGQTGGIVPSAKPDHWLFVARYREDRLVWVRER